MRKSGDLIKLVHNCILTGKIDETHTCSDQIIIHHALFSHFTQTSVVIANGSMRIHYSIFRDNFEPERAGSLFAAGLTDSEVDHVRFCNSSALVNGQAFEIRDVKHQNRVTMVSVTRCSTDDTHLYLSCYIGGGEIVVDHINSTLNTVKQNGAGIWIGTCEPYTTTMNCSLFANNTGNYRILDISHIDGLPGPTGQYKITNVAIVDNSATCGLLCYITPSVLFSQCVWRGNSALKFEGSVPTARLTFFDCTFDVEPSYQMLTSYTFDHKQITDSIAIPYYVCVPEVTKSCRKYKVKLGCFILIH